jgi:hypothetical protein
VNDAGAALAGIAADMRPGQVEMIAQQMHEKCAILAIDRHCLAIDFEFDCGHVEPPDYF